jgi:hypothetical protein
MTSSITGSHSLYKYHFLWYFCFIMNGIFVAGALRSRPPESLPLEPFPGTIAPIGDYFAARQASEAIEALSDEPDACAERLTQYVFNRTAQYLDLANAMTHRYGQASEFMSRYPNGHDLLRDGILNRFRSVEKRLNSGYIAMPTDTVISADPRQPSPELIAGELIQRVYVPPVIQSRTLAWNRWAQDKTQNGEVDTLFNDPTYRHGTKIAVGSLLPAGNLWVEVGEGLTRLRRAPHGREAEQEFDLPTTDEWGSGLEFWFVMSHIAEKDILALSESVQPAMVDGLKLTPEVYARSYQPIIDLVDLNPQLDIKGILSDGSWIYSSELAEKFPDQHVSNLHDIAGKVVELGDADAIGLPIQALFATFDARRRAAYETGDYKVGVAARFIDPQGMIEVLGSFGLQEA